MARAAFRDVSSLLSGSVIAKPFGVASTMLFARILSKEIDLPGLPDVLAGIPNLVLTFGIFSTFMRELPPLFREDEAQARSLILTGALAVLGATLLAALAAVVFAPEIAGRIASCISDDDRHPAKRYDPSGQRLRKVAADIFKSVESQGDVVEFVVVQVSVYVCDRR